MSANDNSEEVKLPEIRKHLINPVAQSREKNRDKSVVQNESDPLNKSMSQHSSAKSERVYGRQRNLNDAKKERTQVEKDARLLQNRIALLRQEEMRTWKKIEETQKRAKEVMEMKKLNNYRKREKSEYQKSKKRQGLDNQRRVKQVREARKREKAKIDHAILYSKKEEAKQTKNQLKKHLRAKKDMNKFVLAEKQKKSQKVKDDMQMALLKKREFERKKLEAAKLELDRKIAEEERISKQKEKEVMQMEMLEMELINRLQNTQNIQKQAYQELEDALAQPSYYLGAKGTSSVVPQKKKNGEKAETQ